MTNAQFRRFVTDTGHVTIAERAPDPADFPGADPADLVPGSQLFVGTAGPVPLDDWTRWWAWAPGASWRHPEGPGSTLHGRDLRPVVHVGYEDASAYAQWAGKALPTEVEWEHAARGGLDRATYPWGGEFMPGGKIMANTWHGRFPWENYQPHGYRRTSPVKRFPPNGYGLFDVVGNVWEWTNSPWTQDHTVPGPAPSCCAPGSALTEEDRRVTKGGSHLCHRRTAIATGRPPGRGMPSAAPPATWVSVAAVQPDPAPDERECHTCRMRSPAMPAIRARYRRQTPRGPPRGPMARAGGAGVHAPRYQSVGTPSVVSCTDPGIAVGGP